MSECMMFPNDWEKFLEDYSFKDKEEVYTNGSMLIPVFRVEQMIEHYFGSKWIPVSERLPDMELEAVMVEDMDLFPCLVCKNVTILHKRKLVAKAWYDGKGFMDIDCMDITDETTHWMPLPEPPKDVDK